MRPSFHRLLRALSLLGPLALASPALAQDIAAAEALFNRGAADLKAGRYEAACKAISESQRLDPRPGTLFSLAMCESKWGHIASASTRFGDYLALYERLTPAQQTRQGERPKVAKEERSRLAADIPELTLSLPAGAPAGTVVKRDGVVINDAALGLGLPVDPGEYTVSTQAPGGPVWEQQITIGKGEKKQVPLEVKAAPMASSVEAPPKVDAGPRGPSGQRTAAYVVSGAGLAGLAVGGVMGGLVLGKKGVVGDHCGSGINSKDETSCDRVGLDAATSAKTLGLASTIGFAIGLAGLGAGAVLLLTAPPPGKSAAGARGRWMSAGVLGVGPAGAMVGARGSW